MRDTDGLMQSALKWENNFIRDQPAPDADGISLLVSSSSGCLSFLANFKHLFYI